MISRNTHRRLRSASFGVLLGLVAMLVLGTGAYAAPTPAPGGSASAPAPGGFLTITGPTIKHALTFSLAKQPTQYSQMMAEVSWMKGRAGDIITTPTTDLGPHFLIVTHINSTVTGRYDLYPESVGGPRSHRQALGTTPEAWFYAPVDMASTLAAVGVAMPTTAPTEQVFVKPTVAPANLKHSLSSIARQSVIALVLAALGCVAILVLLAFAARRSHSADRRRTLPPALGRLASVRASAAAARGSMLRGATPPVANRAGGATRPAGAGSRTAGVTRVGSTVPGAPAPPGVRVSGAATPGAPRQTTPLGGVMAPQPSATAIKRAAAAKRVADAERATEAKSVTDGTSAGLRRGIQRALLALREQLALPAQHKPEASPAPLTPPTQPDQPAPLTPPTPPVQPSAAAVPSQPSAATATPASSPE